MAQQSATPDPEAAEGTEVLTTWGGEPPHTWGKMSHRITDQPSADSVWRYVLESRHDHMVDHWLQRARFYDLGAAKLVQQAMHLYRLHNIEADEAQRERERDEWRRQNQQQPNHPAEGLAQ